MQTKNLKKKGFTLVELVIVVAVIAVLSAILIPTIGCFVEEAKETNDMATVRLLNAALVEDGAENAQPKNMTEVLDAMGRKGYLVDRLTPRSSGDILWDSVNNRFLLRNKEGKDIYRDNTSKPADGVNLWKVVGKDQKVSTTYSNYLKEDYVLEGDTLAVSTGLDVGKNTGIPAIKYENTSGTAQSVIIRTNGGKLIVNAANDHVEHYNLASEVEVKAVSDSTYVEHGTVAKMTVAADAKNVVIKSTAVVVEVDNKSTNLNNEGGFIMKLTEGSSALKSGSVATGNEILVNNYEQLQGLALSSTMGNNLDGKTIKLTSDINMSGKTWTPFGFRTTTGSDNHFTGTIDGQGHKIVGLSNGSYKGVETKNTWTQITGDVYGFIAYTNGDVVVKNITFENVNINSSTAKVCSVVVGDTNSSGTTNLTLENIKVTGSVIGKDKVAGLVGYLQHVENATISNCVVEAKVSASASENESYRAGGLLGYVSSANVTIENSSYKGNVTANIKNGDSWCGLLTSGFAGGVNMTVKDCSFTGTATATAKSQNHNLGYTLNNQYIVGTLQSSQIEGETKLNNGTFDIRYTEYVPGRGSIYTIN